MSDVLNSPRHVANLSHHGNRMKQRHCTSSPVGLLTPVYYDILNPGESVTIKDSVFTLTDAFNKYSLNRFTEHIDYFFVPYDMLWSLFGSFRTNVKDFHSSLFPVDPESPNASFKFPTARFGGLTRALMSFLQDDIAEWDLYTLPNTAGSEPTLLYQDALRILELCGIPISDLYYFSSSINSLQPIGAPDGFNNQPVNLHLLLAYQAIYQSWYRLTDYESFDNACFNVDVDSSEFSQGDGTIYTDHIKKIITPRFRPWKKDFFTNVLPNPTFNSNALSLFSASQPGFNEAFRFVPTSSRSTEVGDTNSPFSFDPQSPADIRQSYMFDKYLQITQHARKDYDSQILAHFGYRVPKDIKHGIQYIGSHSNRIEVQGVESTAAGTTGSGSTSILGELGSRAVGTRGQSKALKFKAPCDGILMGIYSIVPESDYSADGFDVVNLYQDWYHWYVPEFGKKGMVPFFQYEAKFSGRTAGMYEDSTQRLGWRYPYMELKCKYDKVSGDLKRSRKSWLAQRLPFSTNRDQTGSGYLSSPALHIAPFYTDAISLVRYNRNPSDFTWENPVQFNEDLLFATDTFQHSFDFDIVKVTTMPPYGLQDL